MNHHLTVCALAAATATACGGGSRSNPATTTAASGSDPSPTPCAAGARAGGPTPRTAASWAAMATVLELTEPTLCEAGSPPCGPDQPLSVIDDEQGIVAVKTAAGYQILDGLWASYSQAPTYRITPLGDLLHLSVSFDELGREEACLEGEGDEETADCGTATVVTSTSHDDFVIDPATGTVVWQALCTLAGDAIGHETAVTRDGDAFTYVPCVAAPVPVRFTAAQLAACPPPAP